MQSQQRCASLACTATSRAIGGCCTRAAFGDTDGQTIAAFLRVRCGQEKVVGSPAHRYCTKCANLLQYVADSSDTNPDQSNPSDVDLNTE